MSTTDFRKITFSCPRCSAALSAPPTSACEVIECPQCNAAIQVPENSSPVQQFILTTGPFVEGRPVAAYCGIVSVTVIEGVGPGGDIAAWWRDVFGGRSGALEKFFEKMREAAISDLKRKARAAGGNGIIGLQVGHEVLKDGGMLLLAATGTAVLLADQGA